MYLSAAWTPDRFRRFPSDHTARVVDPVTDRQRSRWRCAPSHAERLADLVIVGAGLSGTAAALAAARRGLSVIVVEGTHMIGGQATAAGVSAFDIPFQYDHALDDHGIWGEIVARVLAVYHGELDRPANVGHYRNGSLTPNAVIVDRVLGEMLEEAGVQVLGNTKVTAALRDGDTITGVETTAGPIRSRIVVDASEDGHVLPLAGAAHRLGNKRSDRDDLRTLHPKIQDITQTATIREYPDGIPEELAVSTPPPGFERLSAALLRVFPPAGAVDMQPAAKPGPLGFAGYRAAPDLASTRTHTGTEWERVSRTNLNSFNDVHITSAYLEEPIERVRFESTAILKTLCVMYHLQHVLGLPWAVATDEGFGEGLLSRDLSLIPEEFHAVVRHFPPIPYIRESRRLIGRTTLTGKMISRYGVRGLSAWHEDAVAVGVYHPDLHGGRGAEDFEDDLDEVLEHKPNRLTFGPFPIPLGTLVPDRVDGLLAAEKNISASRMASSAARVHPTVTAVGEAVGVLAALAIRHHRQPRDVPAAAVQLELARGGALITPVTIAGIPVEDPDHPAVALAVTRQLVDYEVVLHPGREQQVVVDRERALAAAAPVLAELRTTQAA